MKPKKLFLALVFLLFSACTPLYTNTEIPESTAPPQTVVPSTTVNATATIVPSSTPEPTATATPDIVALQTQGIRDPWIVTTLGTEIPSPGYWHSALFSPDGRFFVACYNNKISLWEVGSYKKLSELSFQDGNYGVERLAFSSDGRFVAATTSCYGDEKTHLFVWETGNMKQIFESDLEIAVLDQFSEYPIHYYTNAIAFVPNSARLVAANGNTIQIIDMEDTSQTVTIKLGQDVYAEEISFPGDGRFIYVFMAWWQDHGFVSYPRYETKYVLQIWDTNAHFLWKKFEFLESGWSDSKELHGSYLVMKDSATGTLEMMNLENEEVRQLPYRQGGRTITADNKYILFERPEEEEGIEIWTTDSWRMIYRFQPKYLAISDINSDNSLLAIAHDREIIIYDIRIITSP